MERVSYQVPSTAELHRDENQSQHTTHQLGVLIPSPQHHVPLAPASPCVPLPPLGYKEDGKSDRLSLNINKRNQEKEQFELSSSIK